VQWLHPNTQAWINGLNFNCIINLEYRWSCWWSVVLDIGYNDFKRKEINDHFHWWNITPSIRFHFPLKRFKPFINIGPGFYIPREGDNRLGVKAGLGFDYQISDRLLFEMGTDYHHTFAKKAEANFDGKKFAFQHFHVGVVYCLNKKG
jgi:opacity protein-like surface antigen